MRALVAVAVLVATAWPTAQLAQAAIAPPDAPPEIRVEAGNKPFLLAHAVGVQMYTCKPTAGGYAWSFAGPRANLYDERGKLVATHYAGPAGRLAHVVGAGAFDQQEARLVRWDEDRADELHEAPLGRQLGGGLREALRRGRDRVAVVPGDVQLDDELGHGLDGTAAPSRAKSRKPTIFRTSYALSCKRRASCVRERTPSFA